VPSASIKAVCKPVSTVARLIKESGLHALQIPSPNQAKIRVAMKIEFALGKTYNFLCKIAEKLLIK
jgi:hypothetical protein